MNVEENKTWTIKPYSRKGDGNVMPHVRAVTIKPLYASTEAPKCNIYHNISAIVFSKGTYAGKNFFHDFSDVLIPLFITARQFEGEVQILMADSQPNWIEKHKKYLNQISNYEIIDFNQENLVHCYPRVIVGEELGFEVAVNESSLHTNIEEFARMVNSFDVMVGIHGAGLSNEVFLPTNAVLIQIVPLGKIHWIAFTDFGIPAIDMKLKYVQYCISEEESTLIDLYPRDHAVFRDPASFHKQGWAAMGKIYLDQQNVKLNITRFKPVLTRALEFLGGDRNYVTWPDLSFCDDN
ncbi:hypothetical protein LUZ61_002960 [Rhynchospora tenuis]|uniref:Glycosyltransferase n=1 Tax=Rhynchospora tenuis TaxID=198213 RepID=A0AAD5ZK25_9POAL|nr:hypothetical protein LUZ61_002960 [Rhynchospora tenuis]